MSINRALANSVFDETFWFKTHLASLLDDCAYCLIKKNGQISSNSTTLSRHHSHALVTGLKTLELIDGQAQLLDLQDGAALYWVLPLAKESSLFDYLVLLNFPKQTSPIKVNALYFQLLYQLKSLQFSEVSLQLKIAKDWIREEINEISRLQQLMLPDKNLKLNAVDFAYTYKAMKGAGGYYLDIVLLGNKKPQANHDIGIIVADVSGHGPASAVETAMIDAILRTFQPKNTDSSSSEVLNYINQHFFTKRDRGSFLTATVFRYCVDAKILFYANAGHPHAYLKKQDRLIALDQGGIPIGVLRGHQWATYQIAVEAGDTLFVYTDVVIETKNTLGEQFGFERLENALIDSPHQPSLMLEHLEQQMNLFCGCYEYQDDLTMCAIQFV